ncbi:hypothetical protein GOQ29_02980 [Clostridium sp. D2Q-14]|uniref:acyl-CoA dehydratase activase-related protein n=1 Tax=Anaeromonas gelatinilytica TaxID=2683194 RepID=UPI00193B7ADF|nr:acyl-CoA dehydratase activase-related protein [Anaeromonas gelatinilytica]MBS4534574.1 hypothetical protein [Anaeromonas gelatinilytica]
MLKIGIPRGMNYYDFFPIWYEFFSELGAEVLVSPKTNKDILNMGVLNCVDDACLPVKVFHGHTCSIKDKVDYIFIPRVISLEKREYECPKILGLPAMVENNINDLPEIIDMEINFRKNKNYFVKEIHKVATRITKNPIKIRKAYNTAMIEFYKYKDLLKAGLHCELAIKNYNNNNIDLINKNNNDNNRLNILLLGHPYNIYDDYVNMNVFAKLNKRKINVITPNMINDEYICKHVSNLSKRMFWTSGKKIVGSSFFLLEERKIDGIIFLSSFGCGLDSVLLDIVERKSKEYKIPFNLITLDEHSGEAGINTRIEAFIDMLEWRFEDENYFSPHG